MKKLLIAIFLSVYFINPVFADIETTTKEVIEKVSDTSWINKTFLKYGMISSLIVTQSLTGLTEGFHWGTLKGEKQYLVKQDKYHMWDGTRRKMWAVSGMFTYATVRSKNLTWGTKIRRFVGAACLARNAYEFAYKYQRYGNPFDYTENHNRYALVGIKIAGGQIVEFGIGTGKITTPLVDLAFLVIGLLLLK